MGGRSGMPPVKDTAAGYGSSTSSGSSSAATAAAFTPLSWIGLSSSSQGVMGPRCSVSTSSSQKRARLLVNPARPSSSSVTARTEWEAGMLL